MCCTVRSGQAEINGKWPCARGSLLITQSTVLFVSDGYMRCSGLKGSLNVAGFGCIKCVAEEEQRWVGNDMRYCEWYECVSFAIIQETWLDLEMELKRHRELVRCVWAKFRALFPILTATGVSSKMKQTLQRICSMCYDIWQSDLSYEGGGHAAFGEGGENDDQMGVWCDSSKMGVWCDSSKTRKEGIVLDRLEKTLYQIIFFRKD